MHEAMIARSWPRFCGSYDQTYKISGTDLIAPGLPRPKEI